jgi:lambda repressor-like predicted transcriptional regulator
MATVMVILFFGLHVYSEKCPLENKIEKMTTTMSSVVAVSPLDFSKINSAGAKMKKDGSKLYVCLSNMNGLTISQLANDFVLPIKKKDEFIAQIVFSMGKQNKIIEGDYSPQAGYGKPFWVFAEVKVHKGEKGAVVSLGIREGIAKIIEITKDRVCGTFDLKSKTGSGLKSEIKGTFNLKYEIARW